MAGDWMQIDLDLLEKAEVLQLKIATGLGTHAVVGRLVAFWRWVERMGVDGRIRNATPQVVAEVVDAELKFVDVLVEVGWLAFEGVDARIPGWERRFSKAAKQRMEDAKRKQAGRRSDTNGQKPDARPKVTDDAPQTTGTKEELELEKEYPPPPAPPPSESSGGDGALSPAWREVEEDLLRSGVAAAADAVAKVRSNGCSVDDAWGLIAYWRCSTPAWGAGALYQRLLNLRPGQDFSTLWPEISNEAKAVERRQQDVVRTSNAAAERAESEKRRANDMAEVERREKLFGSKLDAMSREQVEKLIRDKFPSESEFLLQRLRREKSVSGVVRESILGYFEAVAKRPDMVLEAPCR